MTFNNLPPQAYTRDDITKAYLWIQTQPESVRRMATTKESLVAIFLQAKRNGDINDQLAPVSSKNFKKDLEHLAAELEQFDKTTTVGKDETVKIEPALYKATMVESGDSEKTNEVIKESIGSSNNETTKIQNTVQEFQKPIHIERTLPAQENKNLALQLDPRSEQIIRAVKAQLNMESEKDIIRMLLVLGYDRIKMIFPTK